MVPIYASPQFDLQKTYEENCQAFKEHVTALDPALAEILFRHMDKLLAGEDPGNRVSRTAFNLAVLAELDALPAQSNSAGS